MTRKREILVETFPTWKENILCAVAWCLGIRGMPVGFIYLDTKFPDEEPTINDLIRNEEESAMNEVRENKLTEKESGE